MRIAPRPDPTDEDLVAELRKTRSESAFRDLHHRHTPRLLRMAQRMLGDSDVDAEDVVQEAWIRALGSLEGFRGDSRFGTWLVRVALNVTVEHIRKAARVRLVALDEAVHASVRPPQHEVRLDLERIIAMLPVGCRTVLLLHDVEGYTHLEIGRMLGIAEGTSKSQLNLARRRAQALFEGGTHGTGAVSPAVLEDDWLVAGQGEVMSQ